LSELLQDLEGVEIAARDIVPDERETIAARLRQWAPSAHLILTTGGTGLSSRDVTPEALSEIADRIVPGLGEQMRAASLKHTPNAPLSRALAVTLGRCLIVALPGSERGARQCFEAIRPSLRHAVEILRGDA
jgi:molybdenum cofactor synthesis domain-containing protein